MSAADFAALMAEMRACTRCVPHLPLGPRPTFALAPTARLLLVGQAPGRRVHETGIPWNDRSGDRLRAWLDLDRDTFYDAARIAILPIGLCYPGADANGGDRPPRGECAPAWHPRVLPFLKRIGLTLLIGSHAQAYYLREGARHAMHETVRDWRRALPRFLPLPHPSWRNTNWLRDNPWFEAELVPELRRRVHALVKEDTCV
jgi:uracil-DNA glycosylase